MCRRRALCRSKWEEGVSAEAGSRSRGAGPRKHAPSAGGATARPCGAVLRTFQPPACAIGQACATRSGLERDTAAGRPRQSPSRPKGQLTASDFPAACPLASAPEAPGTDGTPFFFPGPPARPRSFVLAGSATSLQPAQFRQSRSTGRDPSPNAATQKEKRPPKRAFLSSAGQAPGGAVRPGAGARWSRPRRRAAGAWRWGWPSRGGSAAPPRSRGWASCH